MKLFLILCAMGVTVTLAAPVNEPEMKKVDERDEVRVCLRQVFVLACQS